jgi:hypothetical protein
VSFVTASEKLIHTVNQQRLEVLFFADRTKILPYPNSATPKKVALLSASLRVRSALGAMCPLS